MSLGQVGDSGDADEWSEFWVPGRGRLTGHLTEQTGEMVKAKALCSSESTTSLEIMTHSWQALQKY